MEQAREARKLREEFLVTMAPMRLYPLSLVPASGVPLAFILHFTGLAQFWYQRRKKEDNT